MVNQYFLDDGTSPLKMRLAALLLITSNLNLLECLGEELRKETLNLLKLLESMPDNLGTVIAWEQLSK